MIDGLNLKQRKDLVVHFYKAHSDRGVACTVNHFSKLGIARSTLYKIIKTFQERKTTERKVGSGRKAEKLTPQKRKRLVMAATDKCGVSQAKLALKFGVHKSYIHKVLKIRRMQTLQERKSTRMFCGERIEAEKVLQPWMLSMDVMDDEAYFTFGHCDVPGNDRFYSQNK